MFLHIYLYILRPDSPQIRDFYIWKSQTHYNDYIFLNLKILFRTTGIYECILVFPSYLTTRNLCFLCKRTNFLLSEGFTVDYTVRLILRLTHHHFRIYVIDLWFHKIRYILKCSVLFWYNLLFSAPFPDLFHFICITSCNVNRCQTLVMVIKFNLKLI